MGQVILEHVYKQFDDNVVVNDLNLKIEDHEFIVIVGPSGCGKTTTLRMVAGLEEITSGTIRIGNTVVNDIPPKDRDIAMVFQNYALYPHMNVYDNMAFGLKLRKFPRTEIEQRVNEAAKILGIEQLLERKPKQLSGGQRQRVAVGRAIVRKPAVFLFDEPLSNLDAKLRVQMRAEISRLHERMKTTAIYVTHDQVEAMTMGDRIAILKDGLLQQVGSPLEIYRNPNNLFVGGFIGSPAMNFFKALVEENGQAMRLRSPDFTLSVPESKRRSLQSFIGQELNFGIRPEHIHDRQFYQESAQPAVVPVQVEVVEPMGSETYLHVCTGSFNFVARVTALTRARVSESMELVLEMEQLHVFSADTEEAIR
ncbi:sn-glycerol-3-phosphate ABC transporter ATP-binding protein UgpC [bacterium]|nr:sn-glycerol-3-phosphate ABC transporter ATP-binding protein UgpC [candidate division CSSED10-310 bacterium]